MSYVACLRIQTIRLLVITMLVIVASGCGRAADQGPAFPIQDPNVPRILVIPFENMGSPDDAFFAAGLTKETTKRLAALKGLAFVARDDHAEDAVIGRSAQTIGRELGVDYVLEGSVLYDRDSDLSQQLYVESRLLRVVDGTVMWADRVVRPVSDIFSIQSSISHAVVDNIGVEVDSIESSALDFQPTENFDAYQEYLRGLIFSSSFELAKLELAEQHLGRAITLDPNFAIAYAALSENHSLRFQLRYDRSPQRLASANAAAQRAQEIDPNPPECHRARGYYYYWGQRNYELALTEFSLAAHGRPNDPQLFTGIGLVLRRQGRWEEAVDALKRAANMEPENHESALDLGSTLARMRRFDEAADSCRRAMDLVPDDVYPYVFLARILRSRDGTLESAREILETMPEKDPEQQGIYRYEQAFFERDFEGAIEAIYGVSNVITDPIGEIRFTRALAECECRILGNLPGPTERVCARALEDLEREREDSPGDPAIHAALGWAYALVGAKEEAIEAGKRAVELTPIKSDAMSGHTYLLMLARIYAWADEPYLAVKSIHTAMTTPGWVSVSTLALNPHWDPIRGDPRFQELLRMYSDVE
jgi:TolB-like protein/Flp pilus assembly protein TadD